MLMRRYFHKSSVPENRSTSGMSVPGTIEWADEPGCDTQWNKKAEFVAFGEKRCHVVVQLGKAKRYETAY
jgi:hypothetical protein